MTDPPKERPSVPLSWQACHAIHRKMMTPQGVQCWWKTKTKMAKEMEMEAVVWQTTLRTRRSEKALVLGMVQRWTQATEWYKTTAMTETTMTR